MKYHGNWSIFELYNLPIGLRGWFVERLKQQLDAENKATEDAQKKKSKKH